MSTISAEMPCFVAIVGDSLLARLDRLVVIDDAKTLGRESWIKRFERLYRGFVEVAV